MTASARRSAVSAGRGDREGCSASTIAPSRARPAAAQRQRLRIAARSPRGSRCGRRTASRSRRGRSARPSVIRPCAAPADEFRDREIGLARQRRCRIDHGAAPVRQQERAARRAAVLGDALRIGERKDGAGRWLLRHPPGCRRGPWEEAAMSPSASPCGVRPRARARAVAAQAFEPMVEVDVVAAEPALGQDRRDFGGEAAGALPARIHHHAGEPRRQRQAVERLSFRRDPARPHRWRQDRASNARASLSAAAGGESRKTRLAGSRTPHCARSSTSDERSAARISGWAYGASDAGLRLVPQPVTDARLDPAGAAAALVGGSARDPHRFETGKADIRFVAGHPREAAIDHHPHALDGDRGLRNRGRQHDLAPARRRRRDGAVLRLGVERAVKRDDIDRAVGDALCEKPFARGGFPRRPAGRRGSIRFRRAAPAATASATSASIGRAGSRPR